MTDFSHLSIHETITCLKRKDFSVSELIDFHVSSMENGRELNAFITETADIAREKAIDSDNRYLKGEENLLDGIPIGCLLYTSPSPRDGLLSRMPSSA